MTNTTKAIAMLGVVACLGLTTLPLSSYAAESLGTSPQSKNMTLEAIIPTGISIWFEEGDNGGTFSGSKLTISGVTPGGNIAEGDMNVKVTTNSQGGYTLAVKTTGTETSMKDTTTTYSIPAGVPANNGSTSAWGFKVDDGDGSDEHVNATYKNWTQMTASDMTIKNATGAAGEDDTTNVIFGINAKSTQEPGTYSVSVTFTATTTP